MKGQLPINSSTDDNVVNATGRHSQATLGCMIHCKVSSERQEMLPICVAFRTRRRSGGYAETLSHVFLFVLEIENQILVGNNAKSKPICKACFVF